MFSTSINCFILFAAHVTVLIILGIAVISNRAIVCTLLSLRRQLSFNDRLN